MKSNKQFILEEGKNLVKKHGFYKFTMDQLAKNLKMSKKTIYSHFSSKRVFVSAIIDSIIDEDMRKLQKKINAEHDHIEKLRALFYLYNIKLLKKEHLNEVKQHLPEEWKKFERFIHNRREYVKQIYDEGARAGVFVSAFPKLKDGPPHHEGEPVDLLVFMLTSLISQAFETELTDYEFDINSMLTYGYELTLQMFLTDKYKHIYNNRSASTNDLKETV